MNQGQGGEATSASEGAARFDLRLSIPADPSALAVIRHALGGVATALDFDPAAVADVRLALTEVCSTAIRRGGTGRMLEITARMQDDALLVIVHDRGARGGGSGPSDTLPLPLVAAITETVELRRVRGGGTEVTMTFARDGRD